MEVELSRKIYDQTDNHIPKFTAKPGLTKEVVELISKTKDEPEWMLKKRLQALELFQKTPMPNWGPNLDDLKFDEIIYFIDPNTTESTKWEDVPDEIKRTFDRLGIPEAEKKALAGVGAQFDCLTGDSLIYTNPKGALNIKDIKSGDHVFSLDETNNEIVKAKVKGIMDKGIRPVFELKVRGKVIKATYNHPLLTLVDVRKPGRKRARYEKQWKYLQELKKGDIIAVASDLPDFGNSYTFSKLQFKNIVRGRNQFGAEYDLDISKRYAKVNFPEESDQDLMWLFGFFLGDGYISGSKTSDKLRLNFAIHDKQPEVRTKIKEIILSKFGYKIKTQDEFRLQVNSTKIALFFKKHGFLGNALTKRLPQWVFSVPKSQKVSLIAGYTDADGTVRKEAKDIMLTSISKSLLEEVKKLSFYCGITSSKIIYVPDRDENHRQCYRLQLTGRIKDVPCVHKTKRQRLLSRNNYFGKCNSLAGTTIRKYCSDTLGYSRIDDIKFIGKERVYDIEVEKYHNFVANGIVVHNSSMVYHNIKEELTKKGVIFENMDVALKKYPELVKEYFMTSCIPINDHKFIMLHAAVWSGGTFIYIPKGVKVDLPLQAYFRMNEQAGGQFEHTLIIVDEGAELHYIEGCSSPRYSKNSLHAGCVEIFVKDNAKMRYSSIENWSKNVYNLNTKRSIVEKNATQIWVSGQMGSKTTMLYPCSVLKGEGASTDNLSIAFAGKGQVQDVGAKAIHLAPRTSSKIWSKSISKDGGIANYRGLVKVMPKAYGCTTSVVCDGLLLDDKSISNTEPTLKIANNDIDAAHEAKVGKISEEAIFYLQSRGLSEDAAMQLIVSGFMEPIVRELPLEYALELNKLIELEMDGAF